MNAETLFKRLTNREDVRDIPIIYVITLCIAVIEELPECVREDTENE